MPLPDGDGDRNMHRRHVRSRLRIRFSGWIISPMPSWHPAMHPAFPASPRSMRTSAADRVAEKLGIGHENADRLEVLRQPARCSKVTGFAAKAGHSAPTMRAACGRSLGRALLAEHRCRPQGKRHDIVTKHWAEYGRNYYSRHDYEEVDSVAANTLVAILREKLATLPGTTLRQPEGRQGRRLAYHDPVDQSVSARTRASASSFEGGSSRIVLRLSGTGTSPAQRCAFMSSATRLMCGLRHIDYRNPGSAGRPHRCGTRLPAHQEAHRPRCADGDYLIQSWRSLAVMTGKRLLPCRKPSLQWGRSAEASFRASSSSSRLAKLSPRHLKRRAPST